MASDDLLDIVHQNQVAETEPLDALCDLLNLFPRMHPGIIGVRSQLADTHLFNLHIFPLDFLIDAEGYRIVRVPTKIQQC
jgi:hypothetical protein